MTTRTVTIDELTAALSAEHPRLLLDVRDLIESERGHVPGATILPRRRIEFRIEALVRDRAMPLIVVDSGEDIDDGAPDPAAPRRGAIQRSTGTLMTTTRPPAVPTAETGESPFRWIEAWA